MAFCANSGQLCLPDLGCRIGAAPADSEFQQSAGYPLQLRVDQPTRGLSVALDYSDTDIAYVNLLDFIAQPSTDASLPSTGYRAEQVRRPRLLGLLTADIRDTALVVPGQMHLLMLRHAPPATAPKVGSPIFAQRRRTTEVVLLARAMPTRRDLSQGRGRHLQRGTYAGVSLRRRR